MYIEILTLSIIIDIDRQHWKSCTAVATSEWHTVKICKHSHKRLIDNISDYLYFKNQRMEASNLKLIHISSTWDCTTFHNFLPMFKKKKKIFKNWQVYDWRTKWLIMSGYMDLRRPRVYRRSNVGLVDYVPIIMSSWNFQELLPVTEVTSMQKVKVRGQRSRSQRSQPNFTVSGL